MNLKLNNTDLHQLDGTDHPVDSHLPNVLFHRDAETNLLVTGFYLRIHLVMIGLLSRIWNYRSPGHF